MLEDLSREFSGSGPDRNKDLWPSIDRRKLRIAFRRAEILKDCRSVQDKESQEEAEILDWMDAWATYITADRNCGHSNLTVTG